jgi:hypothetical protein
MCGEVGKYLSYKNKKVFQFFLNPRAKLHKTTYRCKKQQRKRSSKWSQNKYNNLKNEKKIKSR